MIKDNSSPAHARLIGKEFRLKEDLLAIGMCFGCPKDQPAEYIYLRKKGGYIKKMDVVSMGELKKGTVIQLVAVKVTTDWIAKTLAKLFEDDYTKYVYREIGSSALNGTPIELSDVSEEILEAVR